MIDQDRIERNMSAMYELLESDELTERQKVFIGTAIQPCLHRLDKIYDFIMFAKPSTDYWPVVHEETAATVRQAYSAVFAMLLKLGIVDYSVVDDVDEHWVGNVTECVDESVRELIGVGYDKVDSEDVVEEVAEVVVEPFTPTTPVVDREDVVINPVDEITVPAYTKVSQSGKLIEVPSYTRKNPRYVNRKRRLTDDQVRDVRRRYHQGEPCRTLADEYGVSMGTIRNVGTKRAYAEVPDTP